MMSRGTAGRARFMAGRLLLAALLALPAAAQAPGRIRLSIGFSARIIGKSNRTDLTAAMKAWMRTAAMERKVEADPDVQIFDRFEDLAQEVEHRRLDVISVGMDDFVVLEKRVPMTGLFANRVRGRITDNYVVLVRRDQAAKGLADLRGQSIVVLEQNRALLAPLWLDTELMRRHLRPLAGHFGKVTYTAKPSLAIMPLFFKQVDAALMNQAAFETACELNPQLAKELTVLLVSPAVLSSVGAYRANATSASATFYREEATRLSETPGGRLILNLFQTDAIIQVMESDLRETRALLAEHARLVAGAQRKAGAP